MSRLVPAFEQFFDSDGDPLVDGLIDFFESGSSSVRKTTFSDSSEMNANPNPLVLRGDGRCPNVFGTGTYRAVLRTSAATGGVQILQRDPIGGDQNLAFGADWNATQIYNVTDVVRDAGDYWESVVNNNIGNRPSTDDGTNWQQAIISIEDVTNNSGRIFIDLPTAVSDISIKSGQVLHVNERSAGNRGGATYDVVLTSTVTPNTFNIVQSTGVPTLSLVLRNDKNYIDLRAWGAYDASDAGPVVQSAWDQFKGRAHYFSGDGDGAADYTFLTAVTYDSPVIAGQVFTSGPHIFGDGMGQTVFDNQVSGEAMITLDTGGAVGSTFLMGAVIEKFKVIRTTTEFGQEAINLISSYQVLINQVHVVGMTGNGMRVEVVLGDADGSNMVKFRQVRIENCTGWGIYAAPDPGFNEFSFMDLEHVFIQNCGTDSADFVPPSGGLTWKGQVVRISNSAFTLNKNCAFWVPGEAGLANRVTIVDTAFENNEKRNIFVRGLSSFRAINIGQRHNDSFIGVTGIEFDGSSFTIRDIHLDGVFVRATAGNNPFTAFKISGTNAALGTCSVKNVVFDNFDHPGQVRYDGWKDRPTVISYKTSTQNIFNTTSAIIFDVEEYDGQLVYNTANGQFTIPYAGLFSFTGKLTVTGLDADSPVTIELFDVFTMLPLQQTLYNADGVTAQTFDFDFQAALGITGSTRSYTINAFHGSALATKALDVSQVGYNRLSVVRLEEQV